MKNFKFRHYFLLSFIVLIGSLHFRGVLIQNRIKNLGKNIVVKYVRKERYPKTTDFYFSYYVNDTLITTCSSGVKYSIANSDKETQSIDNLEINSFYLAKFNSDYPNTIIVDPDSPITDTLEIEKFGFEISK